MSEWEEIKHPRGKGGKFGAGTGSKDWVGKLSDRIGREVNASTGQRPVTLNPKISDIHIGDKVRVKGWAKSAEVTGKTGDHVQVSTGTIHISQIQKVLPNNGTSTVAEVRAPTPRVKTPVPVKAPSGTAIDVGKGKHPHNVSAPALNGQGRQKLDAMVEYQRQIIPKIVGNTQTHITHHTDPVFDISGVKGNILGVNVRPDFGGKTNEIHINDETITKDRAYHKHLVNSGWNVPSNARSTLEQTTAHEFGHSVHNQIGMEHLQDSFNAMSKALGIAPPKLSKGGVAEGRLFNQWIKDNKDLLAKEVSIYGTTNFNELAAEIWSEFSMGTSVNPARRAAMAAGTVMHEAANGGQSVVKTPVPKAAAVVKVARIPVAKPTLDQIKVGDVLTVKGMKGQQTVIGKTPREITISYRDHLGVKRTTSIFPHQITKVY